MQVTSILLEEMTGYPIDIIPSIVEVQKQTQKQN